MCETFFEVEHERHRATGLNRGYYHCYLKNKKEERYGKMSGYEESCKKTTDENLKRKTAGEKIKKGRQIKMSFFRGEPCSPLPPIEPN